MAKKKSTTTITGKTAIAIRTEAGENQTTFWSRLGVTQSGGSRYESGRNIPAPVKKLIHLVYQGGSVDSAEFAAIQ